MMTNHIKLQYICKFLFSCAGTIDTSSMDEKTRLMKPSHEDCIKTKSTRIIVLGLRRNVSGKWNARCTIKVNLRDEIVVDDKEPWLLIIHNYK